MGLGDNKIIIANLKCYGDISFIKNYYHKLNSYLTNIIINYDICLAPAAPYLAYFNYNTFSVASQDTSKMNHRTSSTGEISCQMLKEFGVKYSIVGHLESRKIQKLNNIDIKLKIENCLKASIEPILCVDDVNFQEQIDILCDINCQQIIIGYEPIGAVGSNKNINAQDILLITKNIHKIKTYLYNKYTIKAKCLYGGSINIDNVKMISSIDVIDGLLIGSASLDIDNFINILNILQ